MKFEQWQENYKYFVLNLSTEYNELVSRVGVFDRLLIMGLYSQVYPKSGYVIKNHLHDTTLFK